MFRPKPVGAQQWLIKPMQSAGYHADQDIRGLCWGLSAVLTLLALRNTDDFLYYFKILKKLQISPQEFNDVDLERRRIDTFYQLKESKKFRNIALTKAIEESLILDCAITSLLDNIFFAHHLNQHTSHLFLDNDRPITLHLKEAAKILEDLPSTGEELVEIDKIVGVFDAKDIELTIRAFVAATENSKYPQQYIPIIIDGATHAIDITYDQVNKKWYFINANDYTKDNIKENLIELNKNETAKLANLILRAYSMNHSPAPLSFEFYARNKHVHVMTNIIGNMKSQLPTMTDETKSHIEALDDKFARLIAKKGITNAVELYQAYFNVDNTFFLNNPEYLVCSILHKKDQLVKKTLELGSNPNTCISVIDDYNAVHTAAISGNMVALDLLIQYGGDLSIKTEDGETALSLAQQYNHPETVEWILKKIQLSDIDHTPLSNYDEDGSAADQNSIFYAARSGNLRVFSEIAELTDNLNAYHPEVKFTALHIAIINNNKPIVEYLLKKNVDLFITADETAANILHLAIEHKHPDMLKFLLTYLKNAENHETIDALIENKNSNYKTPLEVASDRNDPMAAIILINAGAKLHSDLSNAFAKNLFIYGVANNNLIVVNSLAEIKLDFNMMDNKTETALMHAIQNKYSEMAILLIKNGVDLNIPNARNQSPLMLAILLAQYDLAELILKQIKNVNHVDNDNLSALICAVYKGHPGLVEMLIDRGADVNAVNDDGASILMLAIEKSDPVLVDLLLTKGADISIEDQEGDTALKLAQESDNPNLINLINDHASRISNRK